MILEPDVELTLRHHDSMCRLRMNKKRGSEFAGSRTLQARLFAPKSVDPQPAFYIVQMEVGSLIPDGENL
jgi:hypothetical protein